MNTSTAPKRIVQLHIIEGLSDIGGTARMLLSLVRHAEPARTSYVFLCYQAQAVPLAECFQEHGAVVMAIDSLSPVVIAAKAIALARRYDVDVICTHFTRPLVAGAIAATLCRLPLVHFIHGLASEWTQRQRLIERAIVRLADKVACNSESSRIALRKACKVRDGRAVVLPCPVEELEAVHSRSEVRNALGWGEGSLLIGHVGGMIELRDQRTLLHAFARLAGEVADCGLLLVGDGPLRLELERTAHELNIAERINFLGYSDAVGDLLSAMDIYVNPARGEGFGIAVVEAMLAELPVVLADGGSHPELIEDGESGLLYPAGDAEALAGILLHLAKEPERRRELGSAAAARAVERFSPELIASRHIDLLLGVASGTSEHLPVRATNG
jgi:glycosyltransferase involved in cell wall biosynthesis